ncbi:MAG: hypothetical protein L0210_05405 [Rhodospirillales bacterium]|nr:hypothetical protein [Rhodospirillales bacterium]
MLGSAQQRPAIKIRPPLSRLTDLTLIGLSRTSREAKPPLPNEGSLPAGRQRGQKDHGAVAGTGDDRAAARAGHDV